jgi:predicted peptidase
MVELVNAAGGNAKLTIYPGVGHNSWEPAYREPELIPWMLAQHK